MVKVTEGKLQNNRGQSLRTLTWMPEQELKAAIIFHHGIQEHVGRYDYVGKKLAESGIGFLAYDAHGHGLSDPQDLKVHVESWSHLIDDLYLFLDHVKGTLPEGLPLFVAGQSLGGLAAASAALQKQDIWSGLVLLSAACDVEWTMILRVQASMASILSALVPKAEIVPAVQIEYLSQDPEVIKEYMEDPLIPKTNIRVRTSYEALKTMRQLTQQAPELKLPILALHGDQDKVCTLSGVQRLFSNVSSTDKTLKVYEGGYHELVMGPEKDDALGVMIQWILDHVPAAKF